jgi:hypothetical protein
MHHEILAMATEKPTGSGPPAKEMAMQTLADLLIHIDKRQSAILLPEDGTEIGYVSLLG